MPTAAVRACRPMLLGVLAALVVLVLGTGPAAAHSDLRSSDPADGASLATAPTSVSFTFNEDLLAQGNAVTLTEVATGARLAVGPVQVEGPTVTVGWPDESPAGQYRAAYRVVSADGHPISGSITFTVQAAVGTPSQGSAPASAPPSGTAAATPAASPVDATPVDAAPQPEAESGSPPWLVGAAVLVLAALVGGGWLLLRRAGGR